MFKNLTLLRMSGVVALAALTAAVEAAAFSPCGPTQPSSSGWIPPRAEHGAMVESVGGQWILKLKIETRTVPATAINKWVDEKAKQIEQQTGRKPGRKQRKDLKEEGMLELLPKAFSRYAAVLVWINPATGLVAIEATGARVDAVAMALVQAVPEIGLTRVRTEQAPAKVMTAWLMEGEATDGFCLGRDCVLEGTDELKGVVRYKNKVLDADEIRRHVTVGGMEATSTAIGWQGRVSFDLTDALELRRIQFDDSLTSRRGDEDAFDADVAIFTGEMQRMLPVLIEQMGGEYQPTLESPPPAPKHDDDEPDPLLAQAQAIVAGQRRASISLVQRHLRIGYNRAARLLEAMEKAGVVSPMDTSGNREVRAVAA